MPKFHIDEMRGDEVVALHIAHGATPLEAMSQVVGGPFVVRSNEAHWFRVVDERRSQVFNYARGRDQH